MARRDGVVSGELHQSPHSPRVEQLSRHRQAVVPRPAAGDDGHPRAAATPGGGINSIFQEDWWLEAASLDRIETVEVFWDAIKVGQLSYFRTRRLGIVTRLGMPAYTRTLGPVLTLPPSSEVRKTLNAQRVVGELLAKLPPHVMYQQILDPLDASAFAFQLGGCSVQQGYTFRIAADANLNHVFASIDPTTRRLIQGCSKRLVIEQHMDLERFLAIIPLDHAPEQTTHDFAALRRLFDSAQSRGQAAILSAVDGEGRDVASVILVWGYGVLYYWLPQRDRARSGGGGNAFLLWAAIRVAMERNLTFDFDGFGTAGTARFLSSFGISPIARPIVTHRSLVGLAGEFVRSALFPHPRVNCVRPDPANPQSFFKNARNSDRQLRKSDKPRSD